MIKAKEGLKELIINRGYTIASLSEAIGCNRNVITKIHLRKGGARRDTAEQIAHHLGVDFAQIFEFAPDNQAHSLSIMAHSGFKEMYEKRGYTPRTLADALDLHISMVRKINNRKNGVRAYTAERIIKVLDCKFEDIFEYIETAKRL